VRRGVRANGGRDARSSPACYDALHHQGFVATNAAAASRVITHLWRVSPFTPTLGPTIAVISMAAIDLLAYVAEFAGIVLGAAILSIPAGLVPAQPPGPRLRAVGPGA